MNTIKKLFKGITILIIMCVITYFGLLGIRHGYDNIPAITRMIDVVGCQMAEIPTCK